MTATIEFTLINKMTADGWVDVVPPIKKVAIMMWASQHYIACCLWRIYGRHMGWLP
jgi:hypothetical protein